MRVALWPSRYLPDIGGIEWVVHSFAKQLQKSGHEVIIISANSFTTKAEIKSIDGIALYTFPFRYLLLTRNLKAIKGCLDAIKLLLSQFQPDSLHIHGFYEVESFFQVRIAEALQLPTFLTLHGLLDQPSYTIPNCLKIWSLAKGVSCISNQIKQEVVAQGLPKRELSVIYNGLPIPSIPIVPRPSGFEIVMIGRLSEEKCFDQAFLALKETPGFSMTLYGDGDQRERLNALRSQLRLETQITMPGALSYEKVDEALDRASIVVVPSRYEAFSLVTLQAALRRRCVISTEIGGLNEVNLHKKTGLCVEPKNPKALADALRFCHQNPALVDEWAHFAQKRAEEKFSIEKMTKNYLSFYKEYADTAASC